MVEIEESLCYNKAPDGQGEQEMIDGLVDIAARRKLITPTIVLLELFRPFGFLGSQCLLLLQPLLGPLSQEMGRYASLLEDREKIDRLLERLDQERAVWKKGG